tara:strand:+ start:3550 stop:6105 length:2556 start_codon:yes stop_codon:yes gene_type:complete
MALNFVKKLFSGDSNERVLREMDDLTTNVRILASQLSELSDKELAAKSNALKLNISQSENNESVPDSMLPEALAIIREAINRTTGELAYDVQLKGAVALINGQIAEMRTGEGKTLVATLALYVHTLTGNSAHSITVNDYLARRDSQWYAPALDLLGLTVGVIQSDRTAWRYSSGAVSEKSTFEHLIEVSRAEAYESDIVYGTNNEFGFDYLRDNMATSADERSQSSLSFAIVDEADSILIDEARTPLIISGTAQDDVSLYAKFSKIVPLLTAEVHFSVDLKNKSITLTEEGIERLETILGVDNIYAPENFRLTRYLESALKAHVIYQKDKDYVVSNGQIIIVDDFTGRLMEGRRWSDGLHQAVEAKERVNVQQESVTYATITIQNYFRLYEKLSGMTGTAVTEAEEFNEIYKLDVLVIPTNKPVAREDSPDLVFRNQEDKWEAVLSEIEEKHRTGRPVLVGTISIESSERLSDRLRKLQINHQVLNAKQHEREAQIIENAGQNGAVTIATNMAGRGTDIKLGDGVKELGGLHVIGTERHEARRIDNQLRGRCGRQGDPGSTRFFVSFEDEMVKRFAPDWLSAMIDRLVDDGQPLESKQLTGAIGQAQQKVESYNFDIRKHLVKYDDVTNAQRTVVYEQRNLILTGETIEETIREMVDGEIEVLASQYLSSPGYDFESFRNGIEQVTGGLASNELIEPNNQDQNTTINEAKDIIERELANLDQEFGPELRKRVGELILITSIDSTWVEHLTALNDLRQGIGLRAYAQTDPLVAYQREAHDMWQQYRARVQNTVARQIIRARLVLNDIDSTGERNKGNQINTGQSNKNNQPSEETLTRAERRRLQRLEKKQKR